MTGIITDTKIIIDLLIKYFPELDEIISEERMTIKNFINKWLITIFTNDFKQELGYKIWDYLLLDGNIILFKSIFSIFSILKKQLIKGKENGQCLYHIFSDTSNIEPKNKKFLFGLVLKNYDNLNEKCIDLQRNRINPLVFNEIININKNSHMRKIRTKHTLNNKCNKNWPICLANEITRTNPIDKLDYLIFKIPFETKCYDNYFFQESNKISNNNNIDNDLKKDENTFNDFYNIITEREKHNC